MRRTDPELEAAAQEAVVFMENWTGPGHVHPHVVAHRHPDTKRMTFVVRFLPEQMEHVLPLVGVAAGRTPEALVRAFEQTWDGPAAEDLPHFFHDPDPELPTFVGRFTPEQFIYLRAMVDAY
jgi:hypothetical protein